MVESKQPSAYPVSQGELDRFWELAGENSTMTMLSHARVADKLGISVSDHKCLHLILRSAKPLSAGQIAELSGLTTGAVTGVLDRLEQAGYVQRVRDPGDRRKVIVEATTVGRNNFAVLSRNALDSLRRVLSHYSPQQRKVIHDYTVEVLAEMRKEVNRFSSRPTGGQ